MTSAEEPAAANSTVVAASTADAVHSLLCAFRLAALDPAKIRGSPKVVSLVFRITEKQPDLVHTIAVVDLHLFSTKSAGNIKRNFVHRYNGSVWLTPTCVLLLTPTRLSPFARQSALHVGGHAVLLPTGPADYCAALQPVTGTVAALVQMSDTTEDKTLTEFSTHNMEGFLPLEAGVPKSSTVVDVVRACRFGLATNDLDYAIGIYAPSATTRVTLLRKMYKYKFHGRPWRLVLWKIDAAVPQCVLDAQTALSIVRSDTVSTDGSTSSIPEAEIKIQNVLPEQFAAVAASNRFVSQTLEQISSSDGTVQMNLDLPRPRRQRTVRSYSSFSSTSIDEEDEECASSQPIATKVYKEEDDDEQHESADDDDDEEFVPKGVKNLMREQRKVLGFGSQGGARRGQPYMHAKSLEVRLMKLSHRPDALSETNVRKRRRLTSQLKEALAVVQACRWTKKQKMGQEKQKAQMKASMAREAEQDKIDVKRRCFIHNISLAEWEGES